MASIDYTIAPRLLRTALAEAYAPMLYDEEAQRIARALRTSQTEGDIGLASVPIDVVYRAMFAFHHAVEAGGSVESLIDA
jgi:hypothetical protein